MDKKSTGDSDKARVGRVGEQARVLNGEQVRGLNGERDKVTENEDVTCNEVLDGVIERADAAYHEAEELLARKLAEGEPDVVNAQEEAVKRISPRWEIRIQTDRDPIAEETKAYRAIAEEIDDRYDK